MPELDPRSRRELSKCGKLNPELICRNNRWGYNVVITFTRTCRFENQQALEVLANHLLTKEKKEIDE